MFLSFAIVSSFLVRMHSRQQINADGFLKAFRQFPDNLVGSFILYLISLCYKETTGVLDKIIPVRLLPVTDLEQPHALQGSYRR